METSIGIDYAFKQYVEFTIFQCESICSIDLIFLTYSSYIYKHLCISIGQHNVVEI